MIPGNTTRKKKGRANKHMNKKILFAEEKYPKVWGGYD